MDHESNISVSTPKTRRRLSFNKKLVKRLFVLVVILAIVGAGAYLYKRNRDLSAENKLLSNPTEVAERQQAALIAQVGALVDLPSGETPTIATVSDAAKLKDQTFFENAQNGDRVLIFTKTKKAYLYRPSTNKLINIAPINIGNSGEQQ